MQASIDQSDALEGGASGQPPWERIDFAAPAGWVEPDHAYDPGVRAKDGAHVSHLLWSWQVNAEAGKTFYATARRLETALAVQHESQWSLDIDARASRLTLHWLRIVRGDTTIDQLKRERMRLLQRETQLERHVIDGSWTLLLVLEDVRPGDVIEAAYTTEWRHPVRPEGCEVFYVVPPQATVGRHRLVVTSETARGDLRWKASPDAPALREDTTVEGRRRWSWEGAQPTPREPEPNQPSTFLDYTWVQISDLANFEELAVRVETVWLKQGAAPGSDLDPAFAKPSTVDAPAILALIRHIQDSFRYLSINLETGGWVAAAPRETARRRHGDCKDLAWLAATVLREWGVTARPVLVGTSLQEQVASLLPMTMLFNHAILEVEQGGKTRWFDLTARDQGGDFETQAVSWFGQGLVIGREGGGLHPQPGARHGGRYSLRETVLLDTHRNAVSMVEIRLRAEGMQADNLRREQLAHGAEAFAKSREEQAARRLGRTRRVGELRWRDDRSRNVCELVEVFEIADAVYPGEQGQRALYDAPSNLVIQAFLLPEDKPRRGPWDMPYPLEVAHEIVVKSPTLGVGSGPRRRWSSPEFEANLEGSLVKGMWSKRVRFRVGCAEIAPERLPEYRRQLEALFRELGWRLYLPWGHPRGRRGEGFGELGEPGADPVTGANLLGTPDANPARLQSAAAAPLVAVPPTAAAAVANADSVKRASRGSSSRRRRASSSASASASPATSTQKGTSEFNIRLPRFLRTGWVLRGGWGVLILIVLALLRMWLRANR